MFFVFVLTNVTRVTDAIQIYLCNIVAIIKVTRIARFIVLRITFVKIKFIMAAKKVKEPKKTFTYRACESVKVKCDRKAKKEKSTLSAKIEGFLYDYLTQ